MIKIKSFLRVKILFKFHNLDKKTTWKNFKDQNIQKWDYSFNSKADLKVNLEKNKRIWHKIGQNICDHYTQKEGITMKYIDYTDMNYGSLGKVHLILLLDESGNIFYL